MLLEGVVKACNTWSLELRDAKDEMHEKRAIKGLLNNTICGMGEV